MYLTIGLGFLWWVGLREHSWYFDSTIFTHPYLHIYQYHQRYYLSFLDRLPLTWFSFLTAQFDPLTRPVASASGCQLYLSRKRKNLLYFDSQRSWLWHGHWRFLTSNEKNNFEIWNTSFFFYLFFPLALLPVSLSLSLSLLLISTLVAVIPIIPFHTHLGCMESWLKNAKEIFFLHRLCAISFAFSCGLVSTTF